MSLTWLNGCTLCLVMCFHIICNCNLFSTVSSATVSPNKPLSIEPKTSLPVSRHKLTFEEFENHTEDAWDATDDDLLRSALAKINVRLESLILD